MVAAWTMTAAMSAQTNDATKVVAGALAAGGGGSGVEEDSLRSLFSPGHRPIISLSKLESQAAMVKTYWLRPRRAFATKLVWLFEFDLT